jgi:TRAP-type C4-dicarboxylate transport system permease small subunit
MKKRTIEEYLVIIILSIMAVLGFGNVLSRYIFHASFAATEEIEINMFVWVTVLGIAIAFEKGSHLGMTMIYDKFPNWLKKVATVIAALLAISLFAIVDYYVIREIYKDLTLFHMRSEALNIPNWIYTIGIPIFSIFVFEKLISSMIRNIKSLDRGAK